LECALVDGEEPEASSSPVMMTDGMMMVRVARALVAAGIDPLADDGRY
jgi:hypothetical protein